MSWILVAVFAAIGLALHQVCFKVTSQYLSPLWGSILYMQLMVLLLAPFAIHAWVAGERPVWSWPAGAAVLALSVTGALFVLSYLKAFQLSPSPSMVLIITDAGAVALSVVLVAFIFNDSLTPLRLAGVAMAVGGITLALKG